MKFNYETAIIRPTPLRSLVYRIKRDLLTKKIEQAETEEERAQLIEERRKLEQEYLMEVR